MATFMEDVSTRELDKHKHYLRCEDEAEKSYDAIWYIQ